MVVDSYNTLNSGIPNFLSVSLALKECGFQPMGIRLDSGDLADLSKKIRSTFVEISKKYGNNFNELNIGASNDID